MSLLLRFFLWVSLLALFATAAIVYASWRYFEPQLPSIELLKDVQMAEPLRIYSADGLLMAEYGVIKRIPMTYAELPQRLIDAFLAAEDSRFFEHQGVDPTGLARAAIELIRTGEKRQGASTITMQVARNFFLSREKTYTRKIKEMMLSLKIERELSKEEIIELYLNKIYLGKRAYGVGAAASIYYDQPLEALTLAQYAMLAGLPKAPSANNPIANPDRALARRNWVLGRMLELGMIDNSAYDEAVAAPITASVHLVQTELKAPFVAEMVRQELLRMYGEQVEERGFKVTTTIDSQLQRAATAALRNGLLEYEVRHGYRGPEQQLPLVASEAPQLQQWQELLEPFETIGNLMPALVVGVEPQRFSAILKDGSEVTVEWAGMAWAQRYRDVNSRGKKPDQAAEIVAVGDVVRLWFDSDNLPHLRHLPHAAAALASLDSGSGAMMALSGGFDFYQSKFNRVTQAERQPGSNIKPFIYSAALEHGFTAASIINDAPIVIEDQYMEGAWRPQNYSGKSFGATRLREALIHSRNLVSIRLLQAVGINNAIAHLAKFGFNPDKLPRSLSLALGSATMTPLELLRGYATIANRGFVIDPYYIATIENSSGEVVYQSRPPLACERIIECQQKGLLPLTEQGEIDTEIPFAQRSVSEQNLYVIRSIMADVIKQGTGRKALVLKRDDIAGKTGTTNDQLDAWFSGFNDRVVTTAWVGFDQPATLGRHETGGRAALPLWIDYMAVALQRFEPQPQPLPTDIVTVRVDKQSGEYAAPGAKGAMFEFFIKGTEPTPPRIGGVGGRPRIDTSEQDKVITEELF
ncbi:penicillin-binding protein 1A [Ectothiorhodospiraceae bacterium BW-2]|nr:penicillin-binding protein 1A [Ectothiorhodospiraceae bacterium BW-2]